MSLLFSESPVIGGLTVLAIGAGYTLDSVFIIAVAVILLLFLLFFYRYEPLVIGNISDEVIISPCEGTVLEILDKGDTYYVAIFLSPFNKHTQVYPANCTVVNRVYDQTGEFKMVMNLSKSENNEKKIHDLQLNNNAVVQLTQIAGFLPHVICSSEELTSYKAGDYLGMIKFGSRVDLLIPKTAPDGSKFELDLYINKLVEIGDYLGKYTKPELTCYDLLVKK